ncbi:hypothetical protein Bbelb_343320 [Branchiostoma belcheri]|nr:hypothetical protein Bbelb_343320 [Branchiostoma belcheri]
MMQSPAKAAKIERELRHDVTVFPVIEEDILTVLDQKAFDTVPHKRLTNNMERYGVGGKLRDWIEDFLSNRKQRVVVNGQLSSWRNVKSGIQQGKHILGVSARDLARKRVFREVANAKSSQELKRTHEIKVQHPSFTPG